MPIAFGSAAEHPHCTTTVFRLMPCFSVLSAMPVAAFFRTEFWVLVFFWIFPSKPLLLILVPPAPQYCRPSKSLV
ncbi:MAG: hypothetical protein K1X57_01115 [Gemmataceae bacterium]|nr:hypothetical protein [Gemmataceae bacterium]